MDYSKHAKVRYNSREDSIPMRNEKVSKKYYNIVVGLAYVL